MTLPSWHADKDGLEVAMNPGRARLAILTLALCLGAGVGGAGVGAETSGAEASRAEGYSILTAANSTFGFQRRSRCCADQP